MALGLDPDSANGRHHPSNSELERRRATSPLRLVIDDLRSVLTSVADAATFLVVVADADGVILWREGAAKVRTTADRLGFLEGAAWTEADVGTNAIGTALSEAAPVELFSAEHFEHGQHPWYCSAHPIHEPRTGDLIGIVDVSGPALTLHPALGALVESAVRIAESSLWRQHQDDLARLRREVEPLLVGLGPALVVDDHGWVAFHTGVAAGDRIEQPRADIALAVPGLGLCLPERIGADRHGGWLVRPTGPRTAITATLSGLTLTVQADGDPWHITLTPRHALILSLLHTAGPDGLTADQLGRAIFGDDGHVVTARAEVSRLRRAVGALVTTNPYRLADSVRLRM
jgi:hypothetical protein